MQNIIALISSIFSIEKILDITNTSKEFIKKYLEWIIKFWANIRDFWLVLHYARFSVFVLVLGASVLFIDQGRELALRIDQNPYHFLFFSIGLFIWALQNWFGSRKLLNERFGRGSSGDTPLFAKSLRHIPRIMGVSTYLFASVALLLAWQYKGFPISILALYLLITVLSGGLFYYGVIKRHDFIKLQTIEVWLKPATYTYSLFFIAAGIFFPAHIGFLMGSLGIFFFGLSSIVPAGNWAIYYTEKLTDPTYFGTTLPNDKTNDRTGFPVISALLVLAFLLSYINDNHDIRTLDTNSKRASLSTAFADWEKQAKEVNGVKPLIIVATAGGGIRASYWTATVLGGLTDAEPRFRNALFAVSGVSGGSVGSVFYQAALQEDASNCGLSEKTNHPKRGATCYEKLTQSALSQDFLAPNFSSFLYSDLIQRFLLPMGFPDRQQALENGWELSWRNTYKQAKTEGVSASLTSKVGADWLPILLLNSTHMESGKRVVASSIELDDKFTDTVDLLSLIGSDVRLSTAAGNSARFTYVSPAGTLPCKPEGGFLTRWWNGLFCRNGHVVDGGYFENFGAITALQTAQALPDQKSLALKVKPIFIIISSDPLLACSPERKEKDDKKCDSLDDDVQAEYLPHERFANESIGPVKALLSTRSARGILAAKDVRHWVKDCKDRPDHCGFGAVPEFYHFRMEVPDGQTDPALGWMLSKESEQEIAKMLTCSSNKNREAFASIVALLGSEQVSQYSKAVCPEAKL